MNKFWRIIVRLVGSLTMLIALTGMLYGLIFYQMSVDNPNVLKYESFKIAYIIMLSICTLFEAILVWVGFSFIRLKIKYMYIYVSVCILECIYFMGIKYFWNYSGDSLLATIGAAAPLANIGLAVQYVTGFFIWGPVLMVMAYFHAKRYSANNAFQPTQKSEAKI